MVLDSPIESTSSHLSEGDKYVLICAARDIYGDLGCPCFGLGPSRKVRIEFTIISLHWKKEKEDARINRSFDIFCREAEEVLIRSSDKFFILSEIGVRVRPDYFGNRNMLGVFDFFILIGFLYR